MSDFPRWFDHIGLRLRNQVSTGKPLDYLISFGPRNPCTPKLTEASGERLLADVKRWLWMWMSKDLEQLRAENIRLRAQIRCGDCGCPEAMHEERTHEVERGSHYCMGCNSIHHLTETTEPIRELQYLRRRVEAHS